MNEVRNRRIGGLTYAIVYAITGFLFVVTLTYESHPWSPYWPLLVLYPFLAVYIARPKKWLWVFLCLIPLATALSLSYFMMRVGIDDFSRARLTNDGWLAFLVLFTTVQWFWFWSTFALMRPRKNGHPCG